MILLKANIDERYQRMLARRHNGDQAAMAEEDAHLQKRAGTARYITVAEARAAAARHKNLTPPTPGQAEAGNYKKPRIKWAGLEIAIENPVGSVREGKGWRTVMKNAYGYICRSEAVDGDEVDVYLGPELDTAPTVYVVHQRCAGDWKAYDEDKCMLGFESEATARAAYLAHYDDERFLGPITAMPVEEFVRKVKATADKPAMIKATFFKSHVNTYARKDGVVVAAHEDSRNRHQQYADMFKPSLGIRRDDMPQVPSHVKGKFLDELRTAGVTLEEDTVDPKTLKPTQGTYNAENMDHLTEETRAGRYDGKTRILVSSDNRVLDGHHRWAVAALEGKDLPVVKIGMPALELLKVAKKFNDENGVERRGTTGGATIMSKAVLFLIKAAAPS